MLTKMQPMMFGTYKTRDRKEVNTGVGAEVTLRLIYAPE